MGLEGGARRGGILALSVFTDIMIHAAMYNVT